jgi:hypothetical protein
VPPSTSRREEKVVKHVITKKTAEWNRIRQEHGFYYLHSENCPGCASHEPVEPRGPRDTHASIPPALDQQEGESSDD